MKRLKLFFLILILIKCPIFSFGQDVHFSTFYANPMFLNPANTGFGDNLFRIGTMYRNQWSTVSSGYNSYLLSIEALAYNNRIRREGIGVGVDFLSDVAGSLSYGQQTIGISISYFKAIDRNNENYISFGIQGNTSNWGYDISNSIFGKTPEDEEGILLHNIRTFDFGFGIHWQMKLNISNNIQAGIAFLHLNKPSISYYENSDIFLPIKINTYVSDLITISDFYSIKPTLIYQRQNNYSEFIPGADFERNISETTLETKIISLGLYYRVVDAFVLMGKYRHNNFNIGLSYDINISRLTPASKTYGGVELWLLYTFNPLGYRKVKTTIPCPIF